MDIDARAWPEITNNMWANNAHIKQGFDDRVNYTYIYKYLAPEKSLRGFEEMDYFQKLGMFWQLQLKKDTYWAELESLYKKKKNLVQIIINRKKIYLQLILQKY